jgi:protein phosphatase
LKAKVKRVDLPVDKRVIAISDIHGNLKLFQRLLDKVNYSSEDVLVLVGDLIEKGNMSLETLRYIMELSKKNTVHIVSGNCDSIWEDIKYQIDDAGLLRYMILRKNTILNEMCAELSITVNRDSNIGFIRNEILKNFKNELDWLEELPHIIETKSFIFAHGGLSSESLDEQEARKVMKNDAFMEQGLTFSKYVVVGHWPIANYCKDKGCYNPLINRDQRIISIDGGNAIKSEGQLNAFIIDPVDAESFSFVSIDDLPKAKVIENQSANLNTIYISWMDNSVEVLEENDEFSYCKHISSNHKLWIKNTMLFPVEGGMRCQDCTDYILPVSTGDIVSIIERAANQTLIKMNGTIGWIANEKLQI